MGRHRLGSLIGAGSMRFAVRSDDNGFGYIQPSQGHEFPFLSLFSAGRDEYLISFLSFIACGGTSESHLCALLPFHASRGSRTASRDMKTAL